MATAYEVVMQERQALAQQIIDNMKNGYVIPPSLWQKGMQRPHNPVSNAIYKGGNALKLYITQLNRGYTDSRWMTFKQATDNGWKIKAGARSVICEKWIFTKEEKVLNEETGKMEKVTVPLDAPRVNYFRVFNAQDIEGIPPAVSKPPLTYDDTLKLADEMIAASECPIKTSSNGEAYYSPSQDAVYLPQRDSFINSKAFLSVALHEMVHSTGHSTRLNRDLSGSFGSESYAREELRAELGSFFLENDLGVDIENMHFNSHTQYLESWIGALQKDHNELFRACADADRAAQRLVANHELYLQNQQTISKGNVPTITCEWSESNVFEDGKTYSVSEFDRLMKQADDARVAGKKLGIEKYGSLESWEAEDEEDYYNNLGYDKVKFTINLPDGSSITERQDIGDGFGGVIQFLSRIPTYKSITTMLEAQRDLETAEHPISNADNLPEPIEEEIEEFEMA